MKKINFDYVIQVAKINKLNKIFEDKIENEFKS